MPYCWAAENQSSCWNHLKSFLYSKDDKQNDLVHIRAVINSVQQGKLFLPVLRFNSSLMDTDVVLLALKDLPIPYAVAEFGSELHFLKSVLGTSCCSWKHAEKKPSECLCCKIIISSQAALANSRCCGQARDTSIAWVVCKAVRDGRLGAPAWLCHSCCKHKWCCRADEGPWKRNAEPISFSTKLMLHHPALSSSALSVLPPPQPALSCSSQGKSSCYFKLSFKASVYLSLYP